jgi:uncharacterized membrane protein YjjB (DUF3815 family)
MTAQIGDLFAAFLVTAIALIISRSRLAVSTNIVIAGSLFGLVPGAAIVSSAQDLIGGDLLPQRRGQELFIATLLSTLVVGCISRIIATLRRVPVSVYTIPGVVPFLPGLTVYQGMLVIVQGQSTNGVVLLIQAVAIAGTIAMGIALSSFIDPTLTHLCHTLQMHRKEKLYAAATRRAA